MAEVKMTWGVWARVVLFVAFVGVAYNLVMNKPLQDWGFAPFALVMLVLSPWSYKLFGRIGKSFVDSIDRRSSPNGST